MMSSISRKPLSFAQSKLPSYVAAIVSANTEWLLGS